MVSDGLTQRSSENVGSNVGVKDVSQLLLESVKRGGTAAPAAATTASEATSSDSEG